MLIPLTSCSHLDIDELNAALQARDHARCLAKDLKEEVGRAAKELPHLIADAKDKGAIKAEEVLTAQRAESDSALATHLLSLGKTLARKYPPPQITALNLTIATKVTTATDRNTTRAAHRCSWPSSRPICGDVKRRT